MKVDDIPIWVGVVGGITGTVLGILNTVVAFSRNRVKLTVTPKRAYRFGSGYIASTIADDHDKRQMASGTVWRWCIEVTNLMHLQSQFRRLGLGAYQILGE